MIMYGVRKMAPMEALQAVQEAYTWYEDAIVILDAVGIKTLWETASKSRVPVGVVEIMGRTYNVVRTFEVRKQWAAAEGIRLYEQIQQQGPAYGQEAAAVSVGGGGSGNGKQRPNGQRGGARDKSMYDPLRYLDFFRRRKEKPPGYHRHGHAGIKLHQTTHAVCGFMSVPLDITNPAEALTKIDAVYRWYEDFFIRVDDRVLEALLIKAIAAKIPLSVQNMLSDLRALARDLQYKIAEVHRERSRLVVLADRERRPVFINAQDGTAIPANKLNEPVLKATFADRRLEYGDHIRLDRFLMIYNSEFRTQIMGTKHVADGDIQLDPIFDRVDYDPIADAFFLTYSARTGFGLETVGLTIAFNIPSSVHYPQPRGEVVQPFSQFDIEHANSTVVLLDERNNWERVRDLFFDRSDPLQRISVTDEFLARVRAGNRFPQLIDRNNKKGGRGITNARRSYVASARSVSKNTGSTPSSRRPPASRTTRACR